MAWAPEQFDRYLELYPGSPPLARSVQRGSTEAFIAAWRNEPAMAQALRSRAARTTIVFVRGYLGHYLPGNLQAARAAVRRLGFDAVIARNQAGGDLEGNVAAIARQLRRRPTRERLVFCAHSRGGLECLLLLDRDEALQARCDGVALSQTPHGPALVMESILLGRHRETRYGPYRRTAEMLQRAALVALRATRGGYELTSEVWPSRVAAVDQKTWPYPVLQTATWSARPTAWLDSFHGRLAEIAPGRAHDGQFLLEDLIWPRLPHVLLPEVDHAQPVLGGQGFDAARYWLALLTVLLEPAACRRSAA